MVPTLVSSSTMNVEHWERDASMSNRNVNDSSEDEYDREHQNAPWHNVAPFDDPNLHPHQRHFYASNQPPIVDHYHTPHSVATAATPATATTESGRGGGYSSLRPARLKKNDSDDDSTDSDRKPSPQEDYSPDAIQEPLSHQKRHSLSDDPFARQEAVPPPRDQYVDPSIDSFEDDIGAHGNFGGFSAADEYALQESAGFAYPAQPPPAYPLPPRSHHPLQFSFGDHRYEQHQYHQMHQPRASPFPPPNVPPVARLPESRQSPHAQGQVHPRQGVVLPANPNQRVFRRIDQHREPSAEELAQAPTPRARKAIETWYQRFNELIDYKARFGDCNVPQKYPANSQLGIVSSNPFAKLSLFLLSFPTLVLLHNLNFSSFAQTVGQQAADGKEVPR